MAFFNTGKALLNLCNSLNIPVSEAVIRYEVEATDNTRETILERMKVNYEVMKESIEEGLTKDIKSVSGLIGGEAKKIMEHNRKGLSVCGDIMSKAIYRALAVAEVNASMGKIVAAPTAGSCGIIPGALFTVSELLQSPEEEVIKGLFTAAGIGMIIAKNATLAGAEGGCQAECGSASAMAAGAVVELAGGSPEQVLDAASIALKNLLGLVCDPVAGLVEVPCAKRNAIGVANALISAEMALSGVKSVIPFDEVVEAMYKVGKSLPYELRETGIGGLAGTKTALEIRKSILGY